MTRGYPPDPKTRQRGAEREQSAFPRQGLPPFSGPQGPMVPRPNFSEADEELRRVELEAARKRARKLIPSRWGKWLTGPDRVELLAQRVRLPRGQLKAAVMAPGNVVLQGPPGSGKTSLGCAILLRRIAEGDGRERMVMSHHLADAMDLAARRPLDDEPVIVALAKRANDLFIDALGFELKSWSNSPVAKIIADRHNAEKRTIVTVELAMPELQQAYGGGIVRRIYEGATVIQLGEGGE